MTDLRLVLLDVDFTLIRPRAVFDGAGYAAHAERVGAVIDPGRYEQARMAAAAMVFGARSSLEHSGDEHERFPAELVREMGADPETARRVGAVAAEAWNDPANFCLYDDARPVVEALRAAGLTLGLVSNTHRDLPRFIEPFDLPVAFALSSRDHGRVKPCPTIFEAALALAAVPAVASVMVGDSLDADVEGAAAAGLRAILLDRDGVHPDTAFERIATLAELPARLGLA